MTYYQQHKDEFKAYRQAKRARQMSDEQVRQHLASAMPETFQAIVEGVKKNKEPYNQSKEQKARYLYTEYKQYDKEHGYEFNLTKKWILDHIINGRCVYCGCDDWTRLGTDRIDNNKGHTVDNVMCCCEGCNNRRNFNTVNDWLNRCQDWKMIGFVKKTSVKAKVFWKKISRLFAGLR